jgi:hypothetical protein
MGVKPHFLLSLGRYSKHVGGKVCYKMIKSVSENAGCYI